MNDHKHIWLVGELRWEWIHSKQEWIHSRLEGIHSSLEENPFQSLNSIIAWDRADFFSTFALCNAFLNFGPRNISKKSSILKVSKI